MAHLQYNDLVSLAKWKKRSENGVVPKITSLTSFSLQVRSETLKCCFQRFIKNSWRCKCWWGLTFQMNVSDASQLIFW